MATWREKIRREMAARSLNNADVARVAGVAESTVGRWLAKDARPFDASLLKLTKAWGLPADYLIDDSLAEPPRPELSDRERHILEIVRRLGSDVAENRLLGLADDGTPGSVRPDHPGARQWRDVPPGERGEGGSGGRRGNHGA